MELEKKGRKRRMEGERIEGSAPEHDEGTRENGLVVESVWGIVNEWCEVDIQ